MPFQRGYGGGGGSGGGNYGGGNNRGYSSGSGSGVSPWQMGHGQPASGGKVDPLALMGTIMGAMMGGGGQGNVQQLAGLAMANAIGTGAGPDRGYHGDRDRRGERQRVRDRSPPRRNFRSRSRDRRFQRRSSPARRQRSPEKRAEHEIYIGNYPVKFKESDVRKLFEDHGVKVGAIRLKHDGLKVFAFAETESLEQIEKAKGSMEGVEIQGRKLRVRSSKDTDKKKNEDREKEKREERAEERRKRAVRESLKKEDVTKHLVTAFVAFLGREFEGEQEDDRFRDLVDTAKTALITAYNLPEDESLTVPRKIEDIFFRDVRYDVKIEKAKSEEIKVEVKEEKMDEDERKNDNEEDDDGNWKRKGRGNTEEEEYNESLEKNEDNLLDNDADLYNFESDTNSNTNDLNITSIEGTATNETIEADVTATNDGDELLVNV